MKKPSVIPCATSAVLTLAEIKTAIEAFDRGKSNAFDVVDAITVAVEAHRAAMLRERRQPRRDAA